jgi:hypothetical protein
VFSLHEGLRRRLFGDAFRGAFGLADLVSLDLDADDEDRLVVGSATGNLAIDRWPLAAPLRPFLQRRLGVARRSRDLVHTLPEGAAHEISRGVEPSVEKHRADDGLAGVAEDGRSLASSALGFPRAELQKWPDVPRARDLRARLLAHELRQPPRQLALFLRRKMLVEHFAHHEPEDPIAKEFKALVAFDPLADIRGADVGERRRQQIAARESISEPGFEIGDRGGRKPGSRHLTG